MALRTTSVSKCLDKKLTLLGFEVPDLLAIFLTLSILNFVFGQTDLQIFLVWIPTALLAGILYFGKKGKPDNYLVHWLRFQMKPGTYSAFLDPNVILSPPHISRKAANE